MKRLNIFAGALLSGALLSACGGSHGISSPSAFVPTGAAPLGKASGTEKVLYSFKGSPDGQTPVGPLTDVNGVLFGTTFWGGSSYCADYNSSPGCGTVYKLTPGSSSGSSGYQESVIYPFPGSGKDGNQPLAGLTPYNGSTFYGTTDWGGGEGLGFGHGCYVNSGCGTVFKFDPSGFQVVHRFSGPDGFAVNAGIVTKGGLLFGATLGGGNGYCFGNLGCGTVFRLTKSGIEKVLHSFAGGNDGLGPTSLILAGNALVGTTQFGGGSSCGGGNYVGCGTVFIMKANSDTKSYKVLYRFQGGTDGSTPDNVMAVGDVLYGTTATGGGTSCTLGSGFPSGCGTVFKIDLKSGKESILYRFQGGKDGWSPNPLLADTSSGTLYGTTTYGGGYGCGGNGCGTVFQVGPSGSSSYSIVYRFNGGDDSANPGAGVIVENGALYGTATAGGGYGCGGGGCGTVYEVTP